MKILLGGDCDNGGGSYWLAQAINAHTPHEARAVRGYQSYLDYPYDVLEPSPQQLRELVAWADVIHMRERMPRGTVIPDGKPVVVTYTGRLFRGAHSSVYEAYAKGWKICVVTPDMMAFLPEVEPTWLPNPREDMSDQWDPTPEFSVCQAPTSRSAKQTELVIEACEQAGIPLDLIENVSYQECIERKCRAWVTVDQVKYGYGNNAVEAWALGMPAVSGFGTKLAHLYHKAVFEQVGGGELPFPIVVPTVDSIREALANLRDGPIYYDHWIDIGRQHFLRFHHAKPVAEKAIWVYEGVLDERD